MLARVQKICEDDQQRWHRNCDDPEGEWFRERDPEDEAADPAEVMPPNTALAQELQEARHLIQRLRREKEVAAAENLRLRQGQIVFKELVAFAHRQPSQLALVFTHELKNVCDSSRWELFDSGSADVIRLTDTIPCSHRRCSWNAVMVCKGCNANQCRLHLPCTTCNYFTPLPRPGEPLYPTERERGQARARGNSDTDLTCWNYTLRPRMGLQGEHFEYYNFKWARERGTMTKERQVANWHRQIMALDTGRNAPPLARAFDYIKQVPGEWLIFKDDHIYPFHAMRQAANPAFTTSGFNTEEWRATMSYLLTWADIDEKDQAIAEVKTLFLTLQANNVALSYVTGLIWIFLDYLLPRPKHAHERNPDTNYVTGLWLSEEPKVLTGVLHYANGKASLDLPEGAPLPRAERLRTRSYKWLVQYYQCDNPGLGPIHSYAPPLEPTDRKAIYEEVTKALAFPDLPSIRSAPAPINETPVTFWNPSNPECPRCFHNALTCDKRCSSCKIDKHMKKLLQKHGRMTQHQRNRSKNILRERSRNRARGPPEYTLGSHATAYQSDEGRRGRLGYNKHSKQ